MGLDISKVAITRARALHAGVGDQVRFEVADICAAPGGGPYTNLIDRGCFHQVKGDDRAAFGRNVSRLCRPDARFLLLHKAYRDGIAFGDGAERGRVVELVRNTLGAHFDIERVANTNMGQGEGEGGERSQDLPGIPFWLIRR